MCALECTASLLIDQHALSLLEHFVRREGQAASQHTDSVRDVRPGCHGNVGHAAHNAPVAGLADEARDIAALSLAANCVVARKGSSARADTA
eukprot:4287148-Pleurochrysis_carterae.AAC.1